LDCLVANQVSPLPDDDNAAIARRLLALGADPNYMLTRQVPYWPIRHECKMKLTWYPDDANHKVRAGCLHCHMQLLFESVVRISTERHKETARQGNLVTASFATQMK